MRRQPREGWVDSGGVGLHYYDWPGAEPTLLCIHGLTANGRCWDILADRLGNQHRLIAVDGRGRGLSGKPPSGQYGLNQHAQDMAVLLQTLGTGPVVAVGHSMGASVAILLAAHNPELVSQLVLVDGGYGEEGMTMETLRLQLATALQRLKAVFPSVPAYFDYWRRMPFVQPWTEYFERYLEADVEPLAEGGVACRTSAEGVEEDVLSAVAARSTWDDTIRQVRAPAAVLWAPVGLLDPSLPLFSQRALEKLTSLLPNGELVTVEGTNHYTILLSPQGANQIAATLERLLHQ